MSDTPKCKQCGLPVTTGMMAALCPFARECEFWPRATLPEEEGAELLMAKFWMDNARDQIGLQIEDRKRLERELAEANGRLADAIQQRDAERYRPMGDNHHNAVACPYCNPERMEFAPAGIVHYAEKSTAALEAIVRYATAGQIHARAHYPNLEGDFSAIGAAAVAALSKNTVAATLAQAVENVRPTVEAERENTTHYPPTKGKS